jgi:hypothetical protein
MRGQLSESDLKTIEETASCAISIHSSFLTIRVVFKSWLDAYGQSWENRNPEGAAALFTENGTYQVTPFLEPICGRKAIFEYWSEVARTEESGTRLNSESVSTVHRQFRRMRRPKFRRIAFVFRSLSMLRALRLSSMIQTSWNRTARPSSQHERCPEVRMRVPLAGDAHSLMKR